MSSEPGRLVIVEDDEERLRSGGELRVRAQHRLGKRAAIVTPKTHTMHEVVGIMTGFMPPTSGTVRLFGEQPRRAVAAGRVSANASPCARATSGQCAGSVT